MKLYYFALSPYSHKVLIALKEKNIHLEKQNVHLFDQAQHEEFKTIYPLGKLPLLIDNDHFIPESAIILEFLQGHYPNQGTTLIPDGVDDARQVRFKSLMSDNYLVPGARDLFFQSLKKDADKDHKKVQDSSKTLKIMYDYMNKAAKQNRWMQGDSFSMADCAAIPALNLANRVYPIPPEMTDLHDYLNKGLARPSVAQTLAEVESLQV